MSRNPSLVHDVGPDMGNLCNGGETGHNVVNQYAVRCAECDEAHVHVTCLACAKKRQRDDAGVGVTWKTKPKPSAA